MTEISTNGYYAGSNLEKVIRSGEFVVTGELGPPQGWEREEIEQGPASKGTRGWGQPNRQPNCYRTHVQRCSGAHPG